MAYSGEMTDEQIIIRVREGEKELFGEIIRRYKTKLTHYLRKFIKDNDELEDVLQDVFIKTYRNLFDFEADKKFSSWIYRIAHNEALNQIKKFSKEISLDEGEWDIMDNEMDVNKSVDISLARSKIVQCLVQMKDNYREALILHYFEDRSYEEISDIMRIPQNTVGVWISRGKSILKTILQNEYGKPK